MDHATITELRQAANHLRRQCLALEEVLADPDAHEEQALRLAMARVEMATACLTTLINYLR